MKIHPRNIPIIGQWYKPNFLSRNKPSLYIGVDDNFYKFEENGEVNNNFYIEIDRFKECIIKGELILLK